MSSDVLCQVCARPMPSQVSLCPACVAELEQALGDVPALADELQVTLTRQARLGDGGRSSTTPIPFDPRASETAWVLRNTLVGWVRELRIPGERGRPPDDTLPSMSRWLLRHVDRIRTHEAADEAHDEITTAVQQTYHVIDRPADRTYAGPCTHTESGETCGADLYARPGVAETVCRLCGSEYRVEDRQAWMRGQLEDHLGSSSYVAMVATGLGVKVSPSTVRMWVLRHKLHPRHHAPPRTPGGDPQPLYRVGDVIAVAAGQEIPEAV